VLQEEKQVWSATGPALFDELALQFAGSRVREDAETPDFELAHV
jgi:hypothetical protein